MPEIEISSEPRLAQRAVLLACVRFVDQDRRSVEARNQPVGEVEHRVQVLDRLAAHG